MKTVFTELLLVDVLRGGHSTGASVVKRVTNDMLVAKAPMPSPMFVMTEEYKKLMETVGCKVMIGHNRYATVGDKTEANAHPFKFDNLVGAHNGTLDDWALKDLPDSKLFGTDSEALYNSVSKVGIKATIAELTGAWALSWFDKNTNSLNLLRNARRPLFYAYSDDRRTIFWASEAGMLEWILDRNNIKLHENTVFKCDPDKHYRWNIPDKFNEKLDKPIVQEVKEKPYISRSYGGFDWTKRESGTSYNAAPPFVPTSGKKQPRKDTKKFRPPYKDAYGHILNKDKFNELVKTGCVFCDDCNSEWGDFIHPLKDDIDGRKLYLCEECYNDEDVLLLIENALYEEKAA